MDEELGVNAFSNSRAASPLVVPSEDFIVPSPSFPPTPVNLSGLNVLAYYDIPPPSPPPAGPLPNVPPPGSFSHPHKGERDRSLSGSESSVNAPSLSRLNRTTSASKLHSPPEQGLFSQPIPAIHRGKEAPFPAKPILPAPTNGTNGEHINKSARHVGSGLEATVKVPRYRELYALALPENAETEERRKRLERMGEDEVERFERGVRKLGGTVSEQSQEEDEDENELRDVLARFEESRLSLERERVMQNSGQALSRSRSIEVSKKQMSEPSATYDEDTSGFSDDDFLTPASLKRRFATSYASSDDDDDDGASRWTESLYSRASFLDPEKSEEARERFVQRVTEMYGGDGRERDAVPPVPKLPAAYAAETSPTSPKRSWLNF